jgi:hypothetical protein
MIAIVVAATSMAGSALAQGPVGGAVGGVMGGPIGGTLGGVMNGPVGQTVGPITGAAGQSPASAQALQSLLGADPSQSPLVRTTLNSLGPSDLIERLDPQSLLMIRRLRLDQLVRDYPRELDTDGEGNPVRRGELITLDPDAASLAAARAAGFAVLRSEADSVLGMRYVTLSSPRGMPVRSAIKRLKKAAPSLTVDYDHLYEPAGAALAVGGAALPSKSVGSASGIRIAMIDGAVASHPSLAAARIEQRGFAGPAQPTGHGTAVASLLVGNQGQFHGAARGATLFVADVYGGNRAAGSASTIVRALAWAASKQPRVINISLVGPPNALLQRAIATLISRGIPVVAAVGNDGPAAPPQYPASYPNVIAVTGVDSRNRALPEAGRAKDLDFAAPGADMIAALPGQNYATVRGTSFASPLAAARLALTGSAQQLALEARPGKGRVGRGVVCGDCRISPKLARTE